MFNYIRSEKYRLVHKKGLLITIGIAFLLIALSAVSLKYFGEADSEFPYATSTFFYANVIGNPTLILIVAYLFNTALTGQDLFVLKQSVSFGIARMTIYWSKLVLTISYFLLVCAIGLTLVILLGENVFPREYGLISNFLIAAFNMLPLIVSGFLLIHAMRMMRINGIYIIIMVLLIYKFSGNLLRMMFKPVSAMEELYTYAPSSQFAENLFYYMEHAAHFNIYYWITGTVISTICLLLSMKHFSQSNIE